VGGAAAEDGGGSGAQAGAGLRIIYRKGTKGAKEDAKRSRKVGRNAAEDGSASGAQAGAGLGSRIKRLW